LTTSPRRRQSPASRAVRRSRRPAPRQASFLERHRNALLWGGGILVFGGLIFVGLILPGLQPAYACANIFDPTPAPSFVAPSQAPVASGASPAPAATAPAPGYVEPDMGRTHVPPGTVVKYTWCPPASGNHYIPPNGPIRAAFYDQNTGTIPEGWVHNLEHGAIVLLYKCPGPGCEDAGQSQMQSLLARWPDSPICHLPPGGNVTPVITRFDDMPYNFAAIVWDMVLPMDTLDEQALFAFYAAYGEQFNPEKQCASPTSSPPAATTAPATPSPAPSAAPTAASPAPSPAGS
jgi:hypothetical protein